MTVNLKDWKNHVVKQRRQETGCIPTGYEFLLRVAGVSGVDFDSFQDEFDLDKDRASNDPPKNNFDSVASAVRLKYPEIEFQHKAFDMGDGLTKLKAVEDNLSAGIPILVSLYVGQSPAGGMLCHIMPVVEMTADELTLLHSVGQNGTLDILKISKSDFVRLHDTVACGNDIAILKVEFELCFCYGSNMSSARLKARIKSANAVAVASLHNHKLTFDKKSIDGSSKCNALRTGRREDVVIGVVFRVAKSEIPILDRCEGLGVGYEKKNVTVVDSDGNSLDTITYVATNTDPLLRPYEWYKEHVIRGAREHALPAEYVKMIEEHEAIVDPERARHDGEMAIYKG